MATKDALGERMKRYESQETQRRTMRGLPICVRLDGRAFHTWTRGLDRPFDDGLTRVMVETTKWLVEATHARLGYTQSDEITLIFTDRGPGSEPLFGGKFFKLTSVLASLAAAKFNQLVSLHVPAKMGVLAVFDARVFQVPDLTEAANLILWRWLDARKNSISMVAQAHFSSKQLHGQGQADRLLMLRDHGLEWEQYPERVKWGTFVRRETVKRELTEDELDRIPERHRPDGLVTRGQCVWFPLPPLIEIRNRPEVLFKNAEPVLDD